MGFLPYKQDIADLAPFEYMACNDETITVGEGLVITSGLLTKAGATATPQYISMSGQTVATEGSIVPVIKVNKTTVYETTLAADSASIAIGAKYTLYTDGAQITATTTNGVAEVIEFDGKSAGDKVRVRF